MIRSLPVFRGVDSAHMAQIEAATQRRTVESRRWIAARDEPVTGVVLLLRGMVELSFTGPDGASSTLGIVGPGLIGGDAALLDHCAPSAPAGEIGAWGVTVIAATDCIYLWIDGACFMRVMQESAPLAFNVACTLARRLRMMFRRNEWISTLSAPARLARFLVWLDQQREAAQASELPLTQEQLGQLIGVSRETVNKHVRRWTLAGWIAPRGRGLEIRDPDALLTEDKRAASGPLHSGADAAD